MNKAAQKQTLHVVFKTHLDVGFTDYAHVVERVYLDKFIPGAVRLAAAMDEGDGRGFVWTVGSWLVHRALEHYKGARLKQFEDAIARGHVAWHAMPFTVHSELMTPGLFDFGLSISKELDARFGRKTIAAKMTDVPGHTLGMVPRLAAAGVKFLHLGSNPASTPPDVPELFTWRDPDSRAAVTVMYNKGGYGSLFARPHLRHGLFVAFTEDNLGPPPADQVRGIFQGLENQFPHAALKASTFDAFFRGLIRDKPELPVIEQELGDTWIHGAGTAPGKVRAFRALCRLRDEWLQSKAPKQYARKFFSFSENLLLVAEHTWGMDVKTHLPDEKHFTPRQLASARIKNPDFVKIERSWKEQEQYIGRAVAALKGTPLHAQAKARLADCAPGNIDTAGYKWIRFAPKKTAAGQVRSTPPNNLKQSANNFSIDTPHFTAAFSLETGAVTQLRHKQTRRDWAGPSNPLGAVSYQMFGSREVDRFLKQYGFVKKDPPYWFFHDFGKPGLERALDTGEQWTYALKKASMKTGEDGTVHVLLELVRPAHARAAHGAPRVFLAQWTFPAHEPAALLDLQWSGKAATRIPEALWVGFVPRTRPGGQWRLHKMGRWMDPRDVITNGSRGLHAVQSGARYEDANGSLLLETPDAPLVAPGAPRLFDFTNKQPAPAHGIHVNLFNNAWGTNFPQWTDEDARFGYVLRVRPAHGQE